MIKIKNVFKKKVFRKKFMKFNLTERTSKIIQKEF